VRSFGQLSGFTQGNAISVHTNVHLVNILDNKWY